MTAPVDAPDPAHWTEVLPHRPDVMLSRAVCFKNAVVLVEREHGLPGITVLNPETGARRPVPFSDPAYTAQASTNAEFDARAFRYTYQSFLTPPRSTTSISPTLESTLLKRTEVPGGWDPSRYAVEREWATARDGVQVPITLLHRKGTPRDGIGAVPALRLRLLRHPSDVTFSSNRFSLVDRGDGLRDRARPRRRRSRRDLARGRRAWRPR